MSGTIRIETLNTVDFIAFENGRYGLLAYFGPEFYPNEADTEPKYFGYTPNMFPVHRIDDETIYVDDGITTRAPRREEYVHRRGTDWPDEPLKVLRERKAQINSLANERAAAVRENEVILEADSVMGMKRKAEFSAAKRNEVIARLNHGPLQVRRTPERIEHMSAIRDYLRDLGVSNSDTDVIDFALRVAVQEVNKRQSLHSG